MKLPVFDVEQWMTEYEHQAKYNLTDTCLTSLKAEDLLAFEPDLLSNLVLDYGAITGDEALRKEILDLYQDRQPETLTTSLGCLQGNQMVMDTLLSPGDEVIAFSPGYQQFTDYPRSLGAVVKEIQLDSEDWSYDFDAIRAAMGPAVKLIIINNPSNPTGALLKKEQLLTLAQIARENGCWILCDEVYHLPDENYPAMSDLYEKGISTGSLAKEFGLPGLRVGWIKADPQLIQQINYRRDYVMISTGPLQDKMAWAALKHKDEIRRRSRQITEKNKQTIARWLQQEPLFRCVLPETGTVCFLEIVPAVSTRDFTRWLLQEEGIFFIPGACFRAEQYLRLGLGRDLPNLPEILKLLSRSLRTYLQRSTDTLDEPVPSPEKN